MSPWFFHLPENIEGLEGSHPVFDHSKNSTRTLFRTVMRTFTRKNNNNHTNEEKTESGSEHQKNGAQSVGSIPVEGSVSSVRCGGMTFGVQAENVVTMSLPSTEGNKHNRVEIEKDEISKNERQVTFHISCATIDSANHGVCVGLAPQGVKLDTPMVWDEPNVLMISCASTGATVWSDHMGEYGTKISEKCLFPRNGEDNEKGDTLPSSSSSLSLANERFEGKIQLWWNVENGSVRFDVLEPNKSGNEREEPKVAFAIRDYFSKRSKYSAENLQDMFSSLRPTIAFSTVVNEDFVSLN